MLSSDELNDGLQNFVNTYAKNFVIQPFMKGLSTLLEKQIKSATVYRWVIQVEDLTEREYPNFLNDAGKLLCTHFKYVSMEEGLGFDVPENISDNHLKRMLMALKKTNLSKAGTTGKFHDTGFVRTNRDGEQDDITDTACPNCLIS